MNFFGLEIRFPGFPRRERRNGTRARIFEALYLDYKSDNPPIKGTAEGGDISLGGVRFASDKKIPKGTRLELTLRFAAGSTTTESLKVFAQVVRCERPFGHKHYQVGCRFDVLDENPRNAIITFVLWLKERNEKYLFFRYGDDDLTQR